MDKGLDLADLQKQAHGGHPALDRLKGGDRESSTGTGSESEDAESSDAKASGDTYGEVDLDLVKKNPSKVYPQIYYGIKRVLKEWEQSMADRPGTCSLRNTINRAYRCVVSVRSRQAKSARKARSGHADAKCRELETSHEAATKTRVTARCPQSSCGDCTLHATSRVPKSK